MIVPIIPNAGLSLMSNRDFEGQILHRSAGLKDPSPVRFNPIAAYLA
jgi:hypothetical protein